MLKLGNKCRVRIVLLQHYVRTACLAEESGWFSVSLYKCKSMWQAEVVTQVLMSLF